MKFYLLTFFLFVSFPLFAQESSDTTRVESYEVMGMSYHIVSLNQQYGIVNDTGKVILPIHNTSISFLADSEDLDCTRWSNYLKIRQGNRYALAELSGRPLTPMGYEKIELLHATCESTDPSTLVCRVQKGGKYGLLQSDGGLLIRCSYNELILMKNAKEQLTIPAIVRVKRGKKYGCLVLGSQNIIPSEYDRIDFFQEQRAGSPGKRTYTTWLRLKAGDAFGLYNARDNTYIRPEYEQVLPFSGEPSLALVVKNKKYGFIDAAGKQRISGFSYAEPFRGKIAIARKGKRMGAINEKGKPAIDFDFDELRFFLPEESLEEPKLSKLLLAKQDEKVGLLTAEGKWFIKPEWKRIRFDAQKHQFVCEPLKEDEEELTVPLY